MRLVWVAVGGMLLCAPMYNRSASSQAQKPATTDVASHAALVNRTCISCHNDKLKTGGFSLQTSDVSDVPAHGAEVWEKVLRKVRSGEMPPSDRANAAGTRAKPRHSRLSRDHLDRARRPGPNPGRAPVHRLNRAEYSNAIRDLLAVDVPPGEWLPVDDSGYGFDNIAAVLSTSPALLERYMSAARRISRLAVGDLTLKPVEEIYDSKRDPIKGTRNERISDDLPFDSRAGISVQHYFPGRRGIRLQDSHSRRAADRRERSGDRSLPGARPGEGRAAFGRRHVSARESEGRERSAGSQALAPAQAAAAAYRRCRIPSISA